MNDRAAIIEEALKPFATIECSFNRYKYNGAEFLFGDFLARFETIKGHDRFTEAVETARRALAAVPPAPPSKQFTPQQAANLKAAFAEEGIPWPNVNLNSKDTHLAELLQQCVDAFEEDGGDLDHAYRILVYTREVIQWRLRGADGERPAPPSIPERDKLLEALRIGLEGADYLRHEYGGDARDLGCQKIESAIAALEGKP